MIPVRLTLSNFLSYGEPAEMLEFAGLHVFCLSGENGHGKSALLDAITWALFGKARARTDDELVHHGATEMTAIFEFLVEGHLHKVSRVRTSRGKTRVNNLDFFVQDASADAWQPLTGNSISETEGKISRVLGMNYLTFINSAFLLQGRADEFTVKTPAERKKVLADVLDLEVYQRLSDRARAKRQSWAGEASLIEGAIGHLSQEAATLPQVVKDLDAAELRRQEADAALPPAEDRLALLQTNWQHIQAQRAERQQSIARQGEITARLATQRGVIERQLGLRARADETLQLREEILAAYSRWQAALATEQDQGARLTHLQPLQRKLQAAQQAIETAAGKLRQQAAALRAQIDGAEKEAAKLPALVEQLARLGKDAVELEHSLEQLPQLQEQQQQQQATIATANATIEHRKSEVVQLRERYRRLDEGGAECPTCGQPLGEAQRQQLRNEMKQQAEEKKGQIQEQQRMVVACEREVKRLADQVTLLNTVRKRLDALRRDEAALKEQRRAGEAAATRVASWRTELDAVQQALTTNAYAEDQRAILVETEAAMQAVHYDEAAHRAAASLARELRSADQRKRQLDEAEATRRSATEAIEQAQTQLADWQCDADAAAARLATIDALLIGSDQLEQQVREQELAVALARRALQETMQAEALARAALTRVRAAQKQIEQQQVALSRAREQQELFAELTDSFGRNGVQAMLIDEAIPLLAEDANRLLHLMSNGQITLALETQRLAQNKSVVETLEIKIADALGTRSYELYSGGEAFRVNFALRVALSQLLAKRAGTRLQTLIIDEGFGSQDANGRDGLHQALSSIRSYFSCIVVITHLEELKDWFPERVEVFKDAKGSHIRRLAS